MQLNEYREFFRLPYDQFIKQNNVAVSQINKNLQYEKIEGVTRIDLGKLFFFFKDEKLQLIYTSDDSLAKKIWDEFGAVTDIRQPEKTVRSRAGKTSNQLIFAAHGITASITGNEVDFIEIYAPCSLHDYLRNIYREPGLFIR